LVANIVFKAMISSAFTTTSFYLATLLRQSYGEQANTKTISTGMKEIKEIDQSKARSFFLGFNPGPLLFDLHPDHPAYPCKYCL